MHTWSWCWVGGAQRTLAAPWPDPTGEHQVQWKCLFQEIMWREIKEGTWHWALASTWMHTYMCTCMHSYASIHLMLSQYIHTCMLPQYMHTHSWKHTYRYIFFTNQTAQANVQTIIKINIHLKIHSGVVATNRNSLSQFHHVAPSDQSLNGEAGSLVHSWQELQKYTLNTYSGGLDYGILTLSENKYKELIPPKGLAYCSHSAKPGQTFPAPRLVPLPTIWIGESWKWRQKSLCKPCT